MPSPIPMLEISDLHVAVDGDPILKGVDLSVRPGEVHAVMGPNGSGKSSLCHVLAGREGYEVTAGGVAYEGEDLLALEPDDRARRGIFLAFQYPVEIPGVNNAYFLKAAVNAVRRARGDDELDAIDFMQLMREKVKLVDMDEGLLRRPLNEGFSGGEKKRNEILQMMLLSTRASRSSTRPTRASTSTPSGSWRTGSTRSAAPTGPSSSSPTTSDSSSTSSPIACTCCTRGGFARSGGRTLARELEERGYGHLRQERVA